MQPAWVDTAIGGARVARLATVDAGGDVGLVPVCFAVYENTLVGAVDHKPKRTTELGRLTAMRASGRATVLIDHYDDVDWTRLWWVRVRGKATVHDPADPGAGPMRAALMAKYRQYQDRPPTGPMYQIAIDEVRSWRYAAV